MTVNKNYDVIAFKSCIQIFTVKFGLHLWIGLQSIGLTIPILSRIKGDDLWKKLSMCNSRLCPDSIGT